jgi:hypothetical protein
LSCRACWDKTVPNVTYKYHWLSKTKVERSKDEEADVFP